MDSNKSKRRGALSPSANNGTASLDPERVPSDLRELIPYASLWGVSDDAERDALIQASPTHAIRDLEQAVGRHIEKLRGWLAGPESDVHPPSREYLAFSNLVMAFDSL